MNTAAPSKWNQISFGTGWPDFATVVSQPYWSLVSRSMTSGVRSALMKPNVVSGYDSQPHRRRTPDHDPLGPQTARPREASAERRSVGMPRARPTGADGVELAGLAVRVRRRPGQEEGAGRHLPQGGQPLPE